MPRSRKTPNLLQSHISGNFPGPAGLAGNLPIIPFHGNSVRLLSDDITCQLFPMGLLASSPPAVDLRGQ
jgi:hypothetical protein